MENCKLELISKAAVVEKIKEYAGRTNASYYGCGRLSVCEDLLKFLDTLEVKEVDFEKEVTNWWNGRYKKINDDYEFGKYNGHYMENSTIISFARHFFELGIKAQKGE